MILHLVTDEQFTDYAIQQFSAPEMHSEFVLIPSNHENWTVQLIDQCTIIKRNSPEFEALLNRLDQYTGIMMHGMFWAGWQTSILQRVPNHVKVAWYFWGGDIYCRHDLEDYFFAPITQKLYKLHNRKKNEQLDTSWELPLDLYKRVNYCLTGEQEEYQFVKRYTGANFQYIWYTCYSLEDTIGSLMNSHCEGDNIWIGNSAAVGNNHMDVLWSLLKCGLLRKFKGERVIMPLSYGTPWMRNMVKRIGACFWGKRQQVLETYIPRNDYNALMLTCSTMILGYWEPAAQGNIITALWLGMRVYLSEKSMTYSFFKRLGANVFSIESDLKKYKFTPLPEEERDENRRVLTKWYSKQHVMEAVQNVVHALQ